MNNLTRIVVLKYLYLLDVLTIQFYLQHTDGLLNGCKLSLQVSLLRLHFVQVHCRLVLGFFIIIRFFLLAKETTSEESSSSWVGWSASRWVNWSTLRWSCLDLGSSVVRLVVVIQFCFISTFRAMWSLPIWNKFGFRISLLNRFRFSLSPKCSSQRLSFILRFVFCNQIWFEGHVLIWLIIFLLKRLFSFSSSNCLLMHSLTSGLSLTLWSLSTSSWIRSSSCVIHWTLHTRFPHWLEGWDLRFVLIFGILSCNSFFHPLLFLSVVFKISPCRAHVFEQDKHLVHLFRSHVEFSPCNKIFDANQLLNQVSFQPWILRLLYLLHMWSKYLIVEIQKVWLWPILKVHDC